MDYGMRTIGLPARGLWEKLLPHWHRLIVHEDNQAMLQVVKTGRNPTMRYLHRTHRVDVQWLHERFKDTEEVDLSYELSARMCADIYTKAFTDPAKWEHACDLINIISPDRLREVISKHAENGAPSSTDGGDPTQPKTCSKEKKVRSATADGIKAAAARVEARLFTQIRRESRNGCRLGTTVPCRDAIRKLLEAARESGTVSKVDGDTWSWGVRYQKGLPILVKPENNQIRKGSKGG